MDVTCQNRKTKIRELAEVLARIRSLKLCLNRLYCTLYYILPLVDYIKELNILVLFVNTCVI